MEDGCLSESFNNFKHYSLKGKVMCACASFYVAHPILLFINQSEDSRGHVRPAQN